MTHEIQKTMERFARPGTLLSGAFLVGGLVELGRTIGEGKQANVTGVKSYYEDDGPIYFFFRGCGENYQAQAPLLHDKLQGYGPLHFDYQVEGKHSQESIDQNVIDICKEDRDRDRVFVSTSMGLMNTMRSLENPDVRRAVGKNRLRAIVSKSGMTSKYDLQPSMQRAAQISTYVPRLPVIGDMWRMHRLHRSQRELKHSESTTEIEARLHHESSAYMPFPLVASQYQAIHRSTPWQPQSHRDVFKENPELRLFQITAEHDNVTDWHKTNRSLEQSFGIPVETIVDERRPHGSHADDLEFIEPLQALMARLSERHMGFAAAARNLASFGGDRELAQVS